MRRPGVITRTTIVTLSKRLYGELGVVSPRTRRKTHINRTDNNNNMRYSVRNSRREEDDDDRIKYDCVDDGDDNNNRIYPSE